MADWFGWWFLPRFWRGANRFYAYIMGYFWRMCPLCGSMFGGHESGWASVPVSDGTRKICCWKHTEKDPSGLTA